MSKYYYITGTSNGIGKALCEKLLEKETNFITGISRSSTIKNKNYQHAFVDLSDINHLIEFSENLFKEHEGFSEVVLVNNAGILGDIGYYGDLENEYIAKVFQLNTIAPAILTNSFLKFYKNKEKIILNISSGAGRRAIDGWASYCSSKSALDMFSDSVQLEQTIKNNNTKVFSVAPGVVDTSMQSQIRTANKSDFSTVQRFLDLKKNNELSSPEKTAEKLIYLLENKNELTSTILDIRKL